MPPEPPSTSPPSLAPSAPAPEDAARLAGWLRDLGYHARGLDEALGSSRAPLPGSPRVPRLLAAARASDGLGLLARWFLLARPVPDTQAQTLLPPWVLELLLGSGLVRPAPGGTLEPLVLVEPHGELLVASDTYQHRASPGGYDHVLASNPTARHLLDFTPRGPVDSALDLGTGCGIQALHLAAHARRVVATDLNPRAEGFVQLNAALNGISNIETRTGDLWAAVEGEAFDLVVCNPPFVLAPTREFLYRDSGMELDGIVEAVVAGAGRHLTPGGHLHLIAEWVEPRGEGWDDRIGSWMAATGCDGVVYRTHAISPGRYAEGRLREEVGSRATPSALEESWERWRAHHEARGIRQVVGGLVALRNRGPGAPSGPPRLRFDPLDQGPFAGVGDEARRALAADDLLARHAGESLLEARLQVAPDLVLETREVPDHGAGRGAGEPAGDGSGDGRWRVASHRLVREAGVWRQVELPRDMADFVAGFGKGAKVVERLQSLLPEASEQASPIPPQLRAEVLRVVRQLLQRGFLRPAA